MLSRSIQALRRGFIEVKSVKQFEEATKNKNQYIIQFSAKWCGPCKQLNPILYKKQEEAAGAWQVIKIDVDIPENSPICQKNMIEALPTLVFTKNGQQVERAVGLQNSQTLDKYIKLIL